MKSGFHANCISIDATDDDVLIGFADHEFDTQSYLMLQLGLQYDEQDRRLGMDTYHVELNDQRWSCYGGIREIRLSRDRIHVSFNEKGAASMCQISELEITFDAKPARFAQLRHGLERVFVGTDCLVVEGAS